MHLTTALCTIILFMTLIWCWYLVSKNPAVVDVAWPIGLMLLGLMDLLITISWKNGLFCILLIIWGGRLASFLWWTRIRLNIHDKRYTQLDTSWCLSADIAFLLHYQLQGLLILIISLPWFFIAKNPILTRLDLLGILLALAAIGAETLADWQLLRFKKHHKGQVCNQGLWQYSRHPNYFFEWLTWCAFTLCALPTSWGWLAVLSPLTLYLIMTKITAPMTEQGSIKARGKAYLDYQRVTPLFFPKFINLNGIFYE